MERSRKKWLAVLRSDSTDDLRGPELAAEPGPLQLTIHVFPEDGDRHRREIDSTPVPMVAASFEWDLVPGPETVQ